MPDRATADTVMTCQGGACHPNIVSIKRKAEVGIREIGVGEIEVATRDKDLIVVRERDRGEEMTGLTSKRDQ